MRKVSEGGKVQTLDATDKEILKLLQRGDLCVPRVTKIAHLMKLPTSTVHERIRKLEAGGQIRKFQAVLDSRRAGNDLTIFAVLKVQYAERYAGKEAIRKFGRQLAEVPEIQEVHSCSGDWDFLLKIKVKNTEEYATFTQDKILRLGGIDKLESFVVYHTAKESADIEPKI